MFDTTRLRNPDLKRFFDQHIVGLVRRFSLGTPIAADTNYIAEVQNMKVGSYVIAHQPDVARLLTLTHVTVVVGTDTLGTVTITGTSIANRVISEVLTPSADAVVSTTKAFKTVTSIVGAGWVTAGGADTIIVGVGPALGLPVVVESTAVCMALVGTANVTPTVVDDYAIEKCTVDASAGTYDGTKVVYIDIVE